MAQVVFADLCSFQVDHNGKQAYYVLRKRRPHYIMCPIRLSFFFVGCPFDRGVNGVFWFGCSIHVFVCWGFGYNQAEWVFATVAPLHNGGFVCELDK